MYQPIVLNDLEESILRILVDSVKHSGKATTIRVAGGWVRDKLLGHESDDIDVALNDCSGIDFAENVNTYLRHIGEEVHRIGVIQANPDQSKHLETATIRVKGMAIDCVNLRSETYTDESRIPSIRCGTPHDDAMRRDFTLNALFFNASTGEVEDFTGHGLADLELGIIRTPLDPLQTFIDDPLRVLRAVRFAARYNFVLDTALIQAASSQAIREALVVKVSRERILKELDKMLGITNYQECDSRPGMALCMTHKLGLFRAIFALPEPHESIRMAGTFVPPPRPAKKSKENCDISTVFRVNEDEAAHVSRLIGAWESTSMSIIWWVHLVLATMTPAIGAASVPDAMFLFESVRSSSPSGSRTESDAVLLHYVPDTEGVASESTVVISGSQIRDGFTILNNIRPGTGTKYITSPLDSVSVGLIYLAAGVTPLTQLEFPEHKKAAHNNCMKQLTTVVLREELKVTTEYSRRIDAMLSVQRELTAFRRNGFSRVEAFMLLRQVREDWRAAVVLALATELTNVTKSQFQPPLHVSTLGDTIEDFTLGSEQSLILKSYHGLTRALEEMHLDDCWTLRPHMDGKMLQKRLGIPKGPVIGKYVDAQLRWQVAHPGGGLEDCLAALVDGKCV